VLRYDMPVAEAADVFTKLSVGDGLVSQIPALITSLAAGLLVSKGQTLGAAHETFFAQLSASPRALHVTGGILVVMAVMPGLPMLPFITLAAACFATATIIPKRAVIAENMALALTRANSTAEQKQAKESIKTSLDMPKIELALGRQLSARLLSDHSELANRVGKMRKRFARQFGFIVPEIALSDDLDLPPKDYELRIHGSAVARASLPLGELTIILGERAAPDMPYEPYTEPAFGLKSAVIPLAYSSQAKQAGYEPVEDVSVLLTHVSETLSRNLAQLLSYGDVRALLDRLAPEYHRLLDEISPQHLSLSGLQAILKLLLAEQVSVRNLALILEAIAEVAPHVKRPEPIVEHVRMRIGQQICADIADKNSLKVLRLGSTWEQAFQQALRRDPRGEAIGFDFEPKDIETFGKEASARIGELQNAGHRFAIVTAPDVRMYVRMVIERMYPALPVLSHVEIARGAKIEVLGSVS
jgi:flagellar biosynthesis protein FlhA